MDEHTKADIIEFRPLTHREESGTIVKIKDRDSSRMLCGHKRLWIDEERRLLQCQHCLAFFDCYDWVLGIAREQRSKFSDVKFTAQQLERAEQRLEELKKEEQRIKARIRRAKQQATAP